MNGSGSSCERSLVEMLVPMGTSPCLVCREGDSCRQLFIPTCVCVCVRAAFEFSVSTVYVNGHVGLSGVVVTLTLTEGLS